MIRTLTCTLAVVSVVSCAGGKKATTTPGAATTVSDNAAAVAPADDPTKRDVIALEPLRIEVVTDATGDESVIAVDARDLFDRGNDALAAGEYDRALSLYDELIADFADSRLVEPALFNAGLGHEGKEEFDAAIARYRAIVSRGSRGRDPIDALVRAAAVMAELERWTDATGTLEELLARDDLEPSDRVEGLARLGYVLLESKSYAEAEEVLRSALAYARQVRESAGLRTEHYVAMAQYYLAQIPHRQFLLRPIRLPDRQMKIDIEAKAGDIVVAHDRYLAAVEVGDRYWAGAAGYQLASMYKQLWDSLVRAPVPPEITILGDKGISTYNERVHQAARQFLEKSARTHETNVRHADDVGYQSPWIEASRRQAAAIRHILRRERAGELVVPDREATTTVPDAPPAETADYVPGRTVL